jgi:lipopolysaccharide transport system permease protein
MPSTRSTSSTFRTHIRPPTGWPLPDCAELFRYRDFFRSLILRDITVLYKQTILGVSWAVLTPLFSMVVFSVVFGRMAQLPSDGLPYPVFSFIALVPWASESLIQQSAVFTKVYFPRIFIPLVPIASKILDMIIALALLGVLLAIFRIRPTASVFWLPVPVAILLVFTAGLALWFSAWAIQFRDVRHGLSPLLQVLMYASPVVWPLSLVPEAYRGWYALYPLGGVIESFRICVTGAAPLPWDLLLPGGAVALVTLVSGIFYFRRAEDRFADVA